MEDLRLLTLILVVCRFGLCSVVKKWLLEYSEIRLGRYMMAKVIIIGSFFSEPVAMPLGTIFIGELLLFAKSV